MTQAMPKALNGSLLRWNLQNVNYEGALDALIRFAGHFRIPLPALEHPYAIHLAAGAVMPGGSGSAAPQGGWYCTRCGHSFGSNMPLRDGRCPNCHNPFSSPEAGGLGAASGMGG